MASFGMTPPPIGDDYDQSTPLQQATIAGLYPQQQSDSTIPSTGMSFDSTPSWSDTLAQASSTPPDVHSRIQDELQGVASHMKTSQDGEGSKYLSGLAPLLAGAAAVIGGVSGYNAFGSIASGLAQGYTSHLMTQAKEAAALKHESDTKTIDLAHKYLAALPGDVDPQKYPRLAELSQKVREDLVDGKLSSPKNAQDFILEVTKYKHDIGQYNADQTTAAETSKAQAPLNALHQSLLDAGVPPEQAGSAFTAAVVGKNGIMEDPDNPGHYINPAVYTANTRASTASDVADAAAKRAELDRQSREAVAKGNRDAATARVATQEAGRNARQNTRTGGKGASSTKEYSDAYKAATVYAQKKAAQSGLPVSQQDVNDYMLHSGHPPTKTVAGKTYFYIGNDQWSAKGPANERTMTPPPAGKSAPANEPDDEYGEEEEE